MLLHSIAVTANHGWDDGHGPPWPIRLLFILTLIAVAVALYVTWTRRSGGSVERHAHAHAAEVIAERYARGEIDLDEYTERLDHLTPPRRSRKERRPRGDS